MRFHVRIPHFGGSTVEAGPERSHTVLDGGDVLVPNRWKLPPHTVAIVGRPAVWFAIDFTTPRIALGIVTVPARHVRWEQDFGGHLFVGITGADTTNVTVIEAGPMHSDGTGALVPYCYPEDDFAERGIVDFPPIVVAPPNGLAEDVFAELVRATQRSYDGDQRYIVIELPFLRVGRDSNSYAVAVLLCCGMDPRAVPKPSGATRFEWTGYPGAEDPVHRSNFGTYLGAPSRLTGGCVDVAYHNEDGTVRLVVVGGEPNGRARLPDGTEAQLDDLGRIVFCAADAREHGLPTRHTDAPAHIRNRRHFPDQPSPAGGLLTLVCDGRSVPLEPGTQYRGRVVDRHDALGLATLRTDTSDVVLPIAELGVELRDPKRVDALFNVGTELTVGLHRDRHPKLVAHGSRFFTDRLTWRRLHAPRPVNVLTSTAVALAVLATGLVMWQRRPI